MTGTSSRSTLEEQETIIRWDRADPVVSIFSAAPPVIRRLKRLFGEPDRVTPWGHVFYRKVPLSAFRWGRKSQARRTGNLEALARARARRKSAIGASGP